ncbi:hypothetical protein MYX78_10465 [Acidobacteria bacterium AH-259-G07]|nr:hypothetical protein [Acidobacteria bacterium AH-259-G07]
MSIEIHRRSSWLITATGWVRGVQPSSGRKVRSWLDRRAKLLPHVYERSRTHSALILPITVKLREGQPTHLQSTETMDLTPLGIADCVIHRQ